MCPPHHHHIDRLRVLLTALVILHHAAITYGGAGDWFWREMPSGASISSQLLTLFCAVNQAFFMGFFFLIAGFFTPASLARKGLWGFTQDRLLRLGIPMLAFGLALGPLTVRLAGAEPPRVLNGHLSWALGPLWFAWALLLFSGVYAAFRMVIPAADRQPVRPLPGHAVWAFWALAVGLGAWLVRQWLPVGKTWIGLQLGYFVPYGFLFAVGCRAATQGWLNQLTWRQVQPWAWTALLTVPLLPLSLYLAADISPKVQDFRGGDSLSAWAYALWEPWVAWGVIATLLVVFRDRFNLPDARWEGLARKAYGAFVLHTPVLVLLSVLAAGWPLPALPKFIMVGTAAVVASFLLAGVLRQLPGVSRVL